MIPLCIFVGVVDEFSQEVAHHVDDTDLGKLLTWHRHDVEAKLLVVKTALLDENSLLLSDGPFQAIHPLEYVAMATGELVTSTHAEQITNLLLIPCMGRLE